MDAAEARQVPARAVQGMGLGIGFRHNRRAQLLEVRAAVDAAEVRQVPAPAVQSMTLHDM